MIVFAVYFIKYINHSMVYTWAQLRQLDIFGQQFFFIVFRCDGEMA